MPYLQGMAEVVNTQMNRNNIGEVNAALFAPGTDLVEAARTLGVVPPGNTPGSAFLDTMPSGMKEALRAIIYDALIREPRLPVQLTWEAGYGWGMNMAEAPGTADSIGGITVNLRSRYPGDTIPGNAP